MNQVEASSTFSGLTTHDQLLRHGALQAAVSQGQTFELGHDPNQHGLARRRCSCRALWVRVEWPWVRLDRAAGKTHAQHGVHQGRTTLRGHLVNRLVSHGEKTLRLRRVELRVSPPRAPKGMSDTQEKRSTLTAHSTDEGGKLSVLIERRPRRASMQHIHRHPPHSTHTRRVPLAF